MSIHYYSTNDEDFVHSDIGSVIDAMDEPKVGDTYYVADCEPMTNSALVHENFIGQILDLLDDDLYRVVGETADSNFSIAGAEAKEELLTLVRQWADKHVNLSGYFRIVGRTRECKLTADDLSDGGEL